MVENQHTTKCWARLSTNCCFLFWHSSLRLCVSTKTFIGFGLRPRTVACKIKILSVKYIYQKHLIKNGCNKKNPTIRFACEMNRMELPLCVVTELWARWFWLFASNCGYHVKQVDVTCWMYFTHTVSEMYVGLKSFQIAMSFRPESFLSFAYFLAFFFTLYKKSRNLIVQINYLLVNKK